VWSEGKRLAAPFTEDPHEYDAKPVSHTRNCRAPLPGLCFVPDKDPSSRHESMEQRAGALASTLVIPPDEIKEVVGSLVP
jgi:hypothetical protein